MPGLARQSSPDPDPPALRPPHEVLLDRRRRGREAAHLRRRREDEHHGRVSLIASLLERENLVALQRRGLRAVADVFVAAHLRAVRAVVAVVGRGIVLPDLGSEEAVEGRARLATPAARGEEDRCAGCSEDRPETDHVWCSPDGRYGRGFGITWRFPCALSARRATSEGPVISGRCAAAPARRAFHGTKDVPE